MVRGEEKGFLVYQKRRKKTKEGRVAQGGHRAETV